MLRFYPSCMFVEIFKYRNFLNIGIYSFWNLIKYYAHTNHRCLELLLYGALKYNLCCLSFIQRNQSTFSWKLIIAISLSRKFNTFNLNKLSKWTSLICMSNSNAQNIFYSIVLAPFFKTFEIFPFCFHCLKNAWVLYNIQARIREIDGKRTSIKIHLCVLKYLLSLF